MLALVNVASLLLANYAHLDPIKPRKARDHRGVVRKTAVTVDLDKIRKDRV
jgi:hypothetical protein